MLTGFPEVGRQESGLLETGFREMGFFVDGCQVCSRCVCRLLLPGDRPSDDLTTRPCHRRLAACDLKPDR